MLAPSTLRTSLNLLLAVMTCCTSLSALAIDSSQGIPVKVRLEAKPEPTKAVGIVFSSGSSRQFTATTISKIGDKLYEITFAVPRSSLADDSVATAIGFDQTGAVSFANVVPASPSESQELLSSIPECPGEDGSQVAAMTSPGTLQQLIDVRLERMNIARFKIARLMDQDFLAKLQKFEEAFGLKYSTSLSPELPAAELIDRLSRISHAVKKYQLYKPKPVK
jgi:hypothetical protein